MLINDEVRLNVLSALLKKGAVQPNYKALKRETGYHLATIKASIDFLKNEGIITGFGPKISFSKFGYKLDTIELLQMDMSKKNSFEKYLEIVKKDPHIWSLRAIMGSGNLNLVGRHIYKDIESYHSNLQEKYLQKLPDLFEIIKDKQVLYEAEPVYKMSSRTDSIIKLARRDSGLE